MVKVELPSATWDFLLELIDNSDSPMKFGVYNEILSQVDSQEY